jgi:hypothetical protein
MAREIYFRPSAAGRWTNCFASVKLNAHAPKQKAGYAATEGTAAHTVAEICLREGKQAHEFIDRGIKVNEDGVEISVFLDEADCEAIQLYVDTVREYGRGADAEFLVEQKLRMDVFATDKEGEALFGECRGTADSVILDRKNRILTIADLKFGRGVMVDGDSPQLKVYALMALGTYHVDGGWQKIRTTVVQPRTPHEDQHVKEVWHEPADLQAFLFEVYSVMRAAMEPEPAFAPSEKACKWCALRGTCPALAQRTLDLVRDAFAAEPSATPALPATLSTPLPPPPMLPTKDTIDAVIAAAQPATIERWMDAEDLIDAFFKGVKQRAATMLQAGVKFEHYEMKARSGNRRWRDPEAVKKFIAENGISVEDALTVPKLKSPAQLEKVTGIDVNKLKALWEKPEGEPTLVKITGSKAAPPRDIPKLPPLTLS